MHATAPSNATAPSHIAVVSLPGQGEAPLLELPLPEVDAERLGVHCDDEVCHAGPASRAQPEELWRALEAPLLSGARLFRRRPAGSCASRHHRPPCCADPVSIKLPGGLQNPDLPEQNHAPFEVCQPKSNSALCL